MIVSTNIKINYYETDMMGIVHHSNYIRYFETARTNFLHEVGVDYKTLENTGILSPVLSVECKYKKPCTFYDDIVVQCKINTFSPVRVIFEYKIFKDDILLTVGSSSHGFVDTNFNIINLQKQYPNIYNLFLNAKES